MLSSRWFKFEIRLTLAMINTLIFDWAFYKSVSQGELYSTWKIM